MNLESRPLYRQVFPLDPLMLAALSSCDHVYFLVWPDHTARGHHLAMTALSRHSAPYIPADHLTIDCTLIIAPTL